MVASVLAMASQRWIKWGCRTTRPIAYTISCRHSTVCTTRLRQAVHGAFELLHVLLVIVWAPWAAHTGDDGEEEEGGGGAHITPITSVSPSSHPGSSDPS
eukprot:TRINITY_DN6929_c0_g1_i1.p1 TRINITY_DN6929_c0_g1~~TRINITY_DN6929_c0_g1_i1.p1  ORF type:complete len:100 (+),score=3.09 TRINITY_DN6929_c0_g1_i1:121-420(+)